MKTNYTKLILFAFSIILMYGCYDEKEIVSSGFELVKRFDFPQGDTQGDKILEEIYEEHGIMVIYKSIRPEDIDRTWTITTAIGGNNDLDFQFVTDDETLLRIANFYKLRFFDFLNPDISNLLSISKPEYIYITLNARRLSVVPNYVTWEPNYYLVQYQPFGIVPEQGMDSWFTGFVPEMYFDQVWQAGQDDTLPYEDRELPVVYDDYEFDPSVTYKMNIELFRLWFNQATERAFIKVPEGFRDEVDTVTSLSYTETNQNYCTRRGYPEKNSTTLSNSELLSGTSFTDLSSPERDFTYLAVNAIIVGDAYEEHYAGSEYSLFRSRYKKVVDYMKSEYDMDLFEISRKLRAFYPHIFN